MAHPSAIPGPNRYPLDYAVAVWLGMPEEELAKGLREGSIRPPKGVDTREFLEQRGLDVDESVPASSSSATLEPPVPDAFPSTSSEFVAMPPLRDRIEALLRRLDNTMEAATFEAAWREAGADDATRAASLVSFVERSVNGNADATNAVPDRIAALEAVASSYAGGARFLRVAEMATHDLERVASTDAGMRRALAEHSAWALTGDAKLARAADSEGRYDRFDIDTGEALLSDAWVGDRAKYAAWRSAGAAGRPLETAGDGWRFVDRAQGDSATIEIAGTAQSTPVHQVVFATDDGDRVVGGEGTDRLHGGRGDDALRGRAGDDFIEGGAGDDLLRGGAGRDFLHGQQGSDELEGGTGDDELFGGRGADDLAGGRGNDVLRGGEGDDHYLFERGDGDDVIDDDSGVIVFEDTVVAGTMCRSGDAWLSQDGRLRFVLEGDGDAPALVISATSTDDAEAPVGHLRIQAWTQGAFGILLASEPEGEPAEPEVDDSAEEGFAAGSSNSPGTEIGNEAPLPLDERAPPSPDQAHGVDANEAKLAAASLELLHSPGWQSPEPASISLVDTVDVSSALDSWSTGNVASTDETAHEVFGVTPFDVSDALATAEGGGEGEDGAGSVTLEGPLASLAPPRPYDVALPVPQAMLRASLQP